MYLLKKKIITNIIQNVRKDENNIVTPQDKSKNEGKIVVSMTENIIKNKNMIVNSEDVSKNKKTTEQVNTSNSYNMGVYNMGMNVIPTNKMLYKIPTQHMSLSSYTKDKETQTDDNDIKADDKNIKADTSITTIVSPVKPEKMLIPLVDITKAKIGIIYVYYERKNEQKNQTNLSFFIKYGLDEKLWSKLNITTLFVINGHQCEVLIPNKPNIHVLKEDNCSDWEGWYNGIKYFESIENKKIWEMFDYLCLINASAIGPIYESNMNDNPENNNNHWLIPFYNKMVKDNAVVCSPCMSFLPSTHVSGSGPKVVPIMSLIKCDQSIIKLLTTVSIKVERYINTILGKKINKTDAALTGEYGLSLVLINAGYKLTSLLYNFDCHNPDNWKVNNFTEPDRYMSFNGQNVPFSTIFIKNIWRWNNGYVGLPVLYDECIYFIYKKLNMKNIFDKYDTNYNYNTIKLEPGINGMLQDWYSNEEYYKKYGVAEERIVFHNFKEDSNSFLIYAHYDSENMIKDYVIQTIKTFIYLGFNILFYTASNKIYNIDQVPFKINFIKNEYAGTDWKIWLHGCKSLIKLNTNISYVFLLNDSIILPINGINSFKNTIQKMRNMCDFWGHWDSNEIEWYIIGTPIEFKYKMIHDVIEFIENKIKICDSINEKYAYVYHMEVKFAIYLTSKGYKHGVVINIDTIDQNVPCPVFHPANIDKWIKNPNSFAIKWKYMISYLTKNMTTPELNYLTRYLYYGKYGYISDAEKNGVFPKSLP
jgi:hypothetical protein